MKAERDIPTSWTLARIEDIAKINPGKKDINLRDTDEVTFLPMMAVEAATGRYDARETRPYSAVKKGYTPFRDGDVIFAKITPCMENGKIALVQNLQNGVGFGSTEFHVLRPSGAIDGTFLYYYLSQGLFRDEAACNMTGTAGQRRVPQAFLNEANIPLPPLAEQRRIVAKLERLLSQLEQIDYFIQVTTKLVGQFRLAVLDSMMRNLLEKVGCNSLGSIPSCLADGWKVGVLSDVAEIRGRVGWRGYNKEDLRESGPFVIGATHVTKDHQVDLSDPVYLSEEKYMESPEIAVSLGDIIIIQRGCEIGEVGIVDRDIGKSTINPCVLLIKNIQVYNKFLLHYLASPQVKNYLLKGNNSTATPMLTQAYIKKIPAIIPPQSTQREISKKINAEYERINSILVMCNYAKLNVSKLKQSVQTQAFMGKLVPQDPNDEPASILLERIKVERSKGKGKQTSIV